MNELRVLPLGKMNVSIQLIQMDLLKGHHLLLHAVSPRNFMDRNGHRGELYLARTGDDGPSRLHRRWVLESAGMQADDVFLVRQVHGTHALLLSDPNVVPDQVKDVQADAIVTKLFHRPIGVLTADCIPIVLYDFEKHRVAVIHAGRKGTAEKIFSKTVEAMKREYGCDPRNLVAGMGPGVGICCYEVDASCLEPFQEQYPGWKHFVTPGTDGKYMLDLYTANREDGVSAGIPLRNLSRSSLCTACHTDRLYSYRREGSQAGRMLTVAMLLPR